MLFDRNKMLKAVFMSFIYNNYFSKEVSSTLIKIVLAITLLKDTKLRSNSKAKHLKCKVFFHIMSELAGLFD